MIELAFRHSFGASSLDIAFTAPTPGITVLYGPSGAGKSSVAAAIAGLLRPVQARLVIDGAVLCDTARGLFVPPERRRLGVVFQDAKLFPHLSVRNNLLYGARRAPPGPTGLPKILDLLGIAALLARRPHTLSGGERQRVAIGRALLSQPRLLLMDEPLASLDEARRAQILPFIAAIGRELGVPIVYVTHSFAELATLADTVVLLRAGRVVAAGPLGLLSARADLPLAANEGGAVLQGTVSAHDDARQLTEVRVGPIALLVPSAAAPVGAPARLLIPAADIVLAASHPDIVVSVQNRLPATVRALRPEPHRHAVLVELDCGGAAMLARITPDAVARLALAPGASIVALLKASAIRWLG